MTRDHSPDALTALSERLQEANARLIAEFADCIGPDRILQLATEEEASVCKDAVVLDYAPLLIERFTREHLRDIRREMLAAS
jgi:hypothetical protein